MEFKWSKKYTNIIFKVTFTIVLVIMLYIFLNTVFKWFLPFILAYIISHITNPIVVFLEKKGHFPRKLASLTTILFSLTAIISIAALAIYRIVFEIKELSYRLPYIYDKVTIYLSDISFKISDIYLKLPIEISQFSGEISSWIAGSLTTILTSITEYATKFAYDFATSLPSVLLFIAVLFISTYFMSSDKDKISRFFVKQLPFNWISKIIALKNGLLLALFGYIKAELLLMFITFVEVAIGLLIIGVEYSFLLALLISMLDALPLIGSGMIFLPWILFSLIEGNMPLAIGLIILYLIVVLVRQLLEPKIVSNQLGLYPLVTLISVYVGLQVFGVIGLVLGPIVVLVLKNLHSIGIIKLWKD